MIISVFSSGQDGAAHCWKPGELVLVSSEALVSCVLVHWTAGFSVDPRVACSAVQQRLCTNPLLGPFLGHALARSWVW